jgi:DNA-binding CsgD family transcriptional regulator
MSRPTVSSSAPVTSGMSGATRMRPRPAAHQLLSRLQLEWDRLARSPKALARARTWSLPVEHFESLDDLLHLAGLGASGAGRCGDDDVLAALVVEARRDELAARVLLQRLLPGVATIVRRHAGFVAQLDATDELLAAMWTVIRTYPIDERPHYVAAGLLRSADYHAFKRHRRRLAVYVPRPTATFDQACDDDAVVPAADELAELLELARRAGMDDDDLELARRLGRGESTLQIAAARQVTDRTIRNHRAVVAHRLRAVALAVA